MVLTPEEEITLGKHGYARYKNMLHDKILPDSDPRVQRIRSIGERIVANSGFESLKALEWEWTVVDDEDVLNAMVLPGGKVLVFTGILRCLPDDSSIAVVLGHEVGHVVARHVAEDMSLSKLVMMVSTVVSFFIDATFLVHLAYKMAVGLPHSRQMEAEADEIGLILAARACYDTRRSITVWQNMERLSNQPSGLSWLSTHPAHSERIVNLRELQPRAMRERMARGCPGLPAVLPPLALAPKRAA
eukprot:TRINITY_DN3525_c0_g1_i3.p1 TRINITY_DN3525_c0_g1~~TRINITY_DN3525_c0_g1_i3.p1  ORF type:complete len:245 (+),score=50.65 TRINITY_DN3525_c0_g1_i3:294-1028(+)